MTAKLNDALRRRGAIALLLVALLVAASLAVAGCGGDDESGASTPSGVAAFVPASAPLYFDLSTDLDGPQWRQLDALAKQFPAYPQLRRELDEALNSEDVSFDAEIKPLLGDRAAVASLSLVPEGGDESQERFLGVVAIAPGQEDGVKALMRDQGLEPAGGIAGADVFTDPEDGTAFAVAEGAMVVADTREDVQAALEAHEQGGDATLAGSAKYKDAISKLPADVFGQLYIDLGRIGAMTGVGSGELESAGVADATIAASLAAEPEGLRIKGLLLGAPDLASAAFAPSLTKNIPAGAVAYLGFKDISSQVGNILRQVKDGADAETRDQIEQIEAQVPALLGLTAEQLSALGAGEQALAVTIQGDRPQGAILLQVADGAQAKATLDRLRENVPALLRAMGDEGTQVPPFSRVSLVGGVEGWQMPLGEGYGIVYAVQGNLAVIGSSPAAVNAVLRPPAPLSEAPAFRQATAGMPDQVTAVFVLNLQGVVTALRDLGVLREVPREVVANLAPLKSLAVWSTGGQTPTFELFFRIAK